MNFNQKGSPGNLLQILICQNLHSPERNVQTVGGIQSTLDNKIFETVPGFYDIY